MAVVEVVGLLILVLLLGLLVIVIRRLLLQRGGGAVDCSLRTRPAPRGRGWTFGVGRFVGDRLLWYPVFSVTPWPRRTLLRRTLSVRRQRPPADGEVVSLLGDSIVLECQDGANEVQIAMNRGAVTGFLAWLESAPPGSTLPGGERRPY